MAIEARKMSGWDVLRLQVFVSGPAFLFGLVVPNRRVVCVASARSAGRWTMRFLADLQRKYRCDHLWAWFPGGKTLLVLNPDSMDAVLASAENAADPALKKAALSKFVPESLVISSGNQWRDRRSFNEKVLDLRQLHRHSGTFKEIVFREVDRLTVRRSADLQWADFQTLGERISHQVILGSGRIESEMTMQLAHMARRGNWFLGHRRYFAALYERIGRYLSGHRAFLQDSRRGVQPKSEAVSTRCLMHDSAKALEDGSANASTQVPTQIGFWFFVLKDAIELHVARTLALIAAHSEVQDRVREEVRDAGTLTPQAIDDLNCLGACIDEQLRLWTPVPILLRRAVTAFSLRGEIAIDAGQQILIHAGFFHRDPSVFGEAADKFSPQSVARAFPSVYYFSGHRQSCAGQSLVTFLLKATLAALLAKFRFELVGPAIEPSRVPYIYDHFKVALRPLV
jgi:cytochrome P450